MGEERLPKQSIINAKEIGSNNLLDDAHINMRKHSITRGDSEVMNMTPKQWKRVTEKKMGDTINRDFGRMFKKDQTTQNCRWCKPEELLEMLYMGKCKDSV